MPDPFPLNEAALQAAEKAYMESSLDFGAHSHCLQRAVSTYLREAGFEVERRGEFQPHARRPGIQVHVDTERRLVGPWLPVDQVEEEE